MDIDPNAAGGMRNENAPTPCVFPPPESMRPTIVGRDFVVAAGHPLVAQVMADVLERGGSAVDAGVAGGLASNVAQVDMCNLGGIAPIVVRPAGSDQVWSIPGVGVWGREVSLEAFRARYGDDIPLGSAGGIVPAAFGAWIAALERFGSWSFAEVVSPAISLALDGFPLDLRTAAAIEIMGRSFAAWESSRATYWPRGRPPRFGETLVQPELGATLERLAAAETGASRSVRLESVRQAFYDGGIAEAMTALHRADGGWLSRADLASFRTPVELAPSIGFRGWRVYATDLGTQGPAMLQALGILERLGIESYEPLSADSLHLMIEALKLAYLDRERNHCDPAFAPIRQDRLLAPDYVGRMASAVRMDRVIEDGGAGEVTEARPRLDTTYLCAADRAGNVFSAMPSDTLDGAPILPGLGFFVSPRGVQSRLDPANVNALAPGKRPRVTPAPAIATAGDQAIAFGCPGGDVIAQAMLQAFLNLAAHGMTPQQAVESPRVATFSFPGSFFPNPAFPRRVDIEARIPAAVRNELARRGHEISLWPEWEFDAGAVAIAGRLELGGCDGPVLAAAADPRRSAYAVGR